MDEQFPGEQNLFEQLVHEFYAKMHEYENNSSERFAYVLAYNHLKKGISHPHERMVSVITAWIRFSIRHKLHDEISKKTSPERVVQYLAIYIAIAERMIEYLDVIGAHQHVAQYRAQLETFRATYSFNA